MRHLAALFAAFFAAAPLPGAAGGDGLSFTAHGRLAGGYSGRAAGADAFLAGDADLRFAPGWLGRFGAELGIYGRADALDTPHETYGTLTWDFGTDGRLALGVPRPAYDSFAVSQLELAFPALAIDRTRQTRSAATFGAMFAGWLPYGVRLSNRSGTLAYAVSVHQASAPGATVIGLGAAADLGPWALSGAVESVDGDISAKAQVRREFGTLQAGLGYYAPEAAGVSDLVELFAGWTPQSRLTLSAVAQLPTDGTSATAGLSARYALRDGLALSAGLASDAGADPMLNAFLDWRF